MKLTEQWNPADVANERVSIVDVLRMFGVDVPDGVSEMGIGKSMKLRCVWGYAHIDGGVEAAMRVHADTNTAYCFAGCGQLTPVRIYAEQSQLRYQQAARELLDRFGIRPLSWRERLDRMTRPDPVDLNRELNGYAQALVMFAGRMYGGDQYDQRVVEEIAGALKELPETQDREEWLSRWKSQLSPS